MSKWFISLVAFLIYAGIAEWAYLCPVTHVICPLESEEATAVVSDPDPAPEAEIDLKPIMFNWNNQGAITTDRYTEAYRQQILADNNPNQMIEITGFYSPKEENNTDFENLGFARAQAIADLFPEIPKERITLLSQRIDTPADDPGYLLNFSKIQWVDKPAEEEEEVARVVEVADRQIAYFPFNSANPILPQELTTYLENLAENLKATGGSVRLVGHTDNIGSAESNEALGKSRAMSMRNALVDYGVDAANIKVESMGEREPSATNDTEQGRARNRRVEIIYNK